MVIFGFVSIVSIGYMGSLVEFVLVFFVFFWLVVVKIKGKVIVVFKMFGCFLLIVY